MQCSASSFRRELKRYEEEGPEAILGKYGKNRGRSYALNTLGEYVENAMELFISLYMTDNQPAVYGCWLRTAARMWSLKSEREGGSIEEFNASFSSCSTFVRALKARLNDEEICIAREGYDAFNRKHMVHIDRDYSEMGASSGWFSDHHKLDCMCLDEKGIPNRPWITVWRDIRTEYWLGWHIRLEAPSTEVVSQTFVDCVAR